MIVSIAVGQGLVAGIIGTAEHASASVAARRRALKRTRLPARERLLGQ
jgi:hypothetical protein